MAERPLGARDQRRKRIVIQPLQHQHLAARHQRAGQREGRILGGRADQGDRAVLDLGEQTVLLGAIEAVDLVDEQERGLAGAPPRLRLLVDLAQIGHARHHRRQLDQRLIEAPGEQPGQRGLAGAGRAPQDDRAELAAGEHAPERRVGAEQMVLADQLVEGLRAQPVGERLPDRGAGAPGGALGLGEQIAHRPITTASSAPGARQLEPRGTAADRCRTVFAAATTSIGCPATRAHQIAPPQAPAAGRTSHHALPARPRADADAGAQNSTNARHGSDHAAAPAVVAAPAAAQPQAAAASPVSASCPIRARSGIQALGRDIAIDELDHRHRRVVAEPEARLEHAHIAARPLGIARRQHVDQLASRSRRRGSWRSAAAWRADRRACRASPASRRTA